MHPRATTRERPSVLPAIVAVLLNVAMVTPIAIAPRALATDGLMVMKQQVDAQGEPKTEPIEAGDTARFEILVWNLGPDDALDVIVEDTLPAGVSWSIDAPDGVDCASSIGPDGRQSFSCLLGDLPITAFEDAVSILVFGETDPADCGELANEATVRTSNDGGGVRKGGATITVHCPALPTLVIDKVADTEVIGISGSGDALVVTPSVVTWTLTYTLSNGPVSNAVITDEVPAGFEFLDASDGGELVDGAVTWTFVALARSGGVTFRTTVDPETISRTEPTVNVAVIDSDETEPDDGGDSVRVTVEPPPLGGTPTPEPPTPERSLPNTGYAIGTHGEPITVPVELLGIVFLGSAGTMAVANVKARTGRR